MPLIQKIIRKIYKLFYPVWGEILMLHRVVNQRSILIDNRLMEITPQFLEKAVLEYKKKNYQFVSIDDVYKMAVEKKHPRQKFVCFTFDDGYTDNYEIAYPIFKKYNIPFAIYITTDFPNLKAILWWYALEDIILNNSVVKLGDGSEYVCNDMDEKNIAFRTIREKIFELQSGGSIKSVVEQLFVNYDLSYENIVKENALNWEQIKLLANDPICTIGSHTVSHSALDKLEEKAIVFEMEKSNSEIEKYLQKKVEHFAYPYGRTNREVLEAVKDAKYKTALLANGGKIRRDVQLFELKRLSLIEK